MELACRSYFDEPSGTLTPENWPPAYDQKRATQVRAVLDSVLRNCVQFAASPSRRDS